MDTQQLGILNANQNHLLWYEINILEAFANSSSLSEYGKKK